MNEARTIILLVFGASVTMIGECSLVFDILVFETTFKYVKLLAQKRKTKGEKI